MMSPIAKKTEHCGAISKPIKRAFTSNRFPSLPLSLPTGLRSRLEAAAAAAAAEEEEVVVEGRRRKKRIEVLNEKFDFFGKLLLLAPNYPACVKPAGRSSGFERRKLFTLYLMALGGRL